MPSAFAWLDYSESERRRVLDVVRSLGERDTRDELGLATVRDGFADLLAPGISTIQTRLRYFLFIPWIYQDLEARLRRRSGVTTKDWVAARARQEEVRLIEALVASSDTEGVIGRAAGKAVQRLPSSVYWNGLAVWGIRLCPWHLDGYHHRLAVHGPPSRPGDDDWSGVPNWHPGLPPAPEDFPEGAVMALQPHEAEYLRERILETQPNSLLGQLVLNPDPPTDADYPWHALDLDVELPPGVARDLRHAREFSLAMHGAALIYNLMLAEAQSQPRKDWIERYRSRIGDWAEEVRASAGRFAAWDRRAFWATVEKVRPHVPLRSRQFINTWLDWLLGASDPAALADDERVRRLIETRERELKRGQARLHNPRMLELWNGDNGSGTARLAFRWGVMRTHLRDLHAGLAGAAEAGDA